MTSCLVKLIIEICLSIPNVFCLTFGGTYHWGDTSFKGLKTIK